MYKRQVTYQPDEKLKFLYQYFRENEKIIDLQDVKKENLHIISDQVLEMIGQNASGWENMVPVKVSKLIKKNYMFNMPIPLAIDNED